MVRSRHGSATIDRRADGQIAYRVEGGDPFGYTVDLSGTSASDDMLRATWHTHYPDAPDQLSLLFKSPRCGDIVVSAAVGYDLRDKHERPEHKSGHGALHEEHLRVPVLSTQPLPGAHLRTVDVFSTILRWLGRPLPDGNDGRDLMGGSDSDTR